jgi:tRNA 2-thiouridine synthesizing protein A
MTGPVDIDVLGLRCPIPVQRVRLALRNLLEGGVIHLLGDDPESLHDIPALMDRLGLPPAEITKMNNGWLYVINKPVRNTKAD